MLKRKIFLTLIVGLSTVLLVSQTHSQTGEAFRGRGGSGSGRSGGQSRRIQTQQTEETKALSLKGAVGVTDEQWKAIKVKLDKVKRLRKAAIMEIFTGGGGRSGSQNRGGRSSGTGMRGGAGVSISSGSMSGSMGPETRTFGDSWMQWRWGKAWEAEGARREDQKLCDDLFRLLKDKSANKGRIRQKMEALREARVDTKKKLAEADQVLRKEITIDQEARLLVLGWLD